MALRLLSVLLYVASPAAATTGGTAGSDTAPHPFSAICRITGACTLQAGCIALPSPGEVLVVFDGTATAMGQSESDLSPVDRFARLEDAAPLPRLETGRREILLDLPRQEADRRFALFVQRPVAASDAPILQPRYFVMTCRDVAR